MQPSEKTIVEVVYKCKNRASRWVENSPMSDVLSSFMHSMEDVTHYARGLQFGILEFHFDTKDTACAMSMVPITGKVGCFTPHIWTGKWRR